MRNACTTDRAIYRGREGWSTSEDDADFYFVWDLDGVTYERINMFGMVIINAYRPNYYHPGVLIHSFRFTSDGMREN